MKSKILISILLTLLVFGDIITTKIVLHSDLVYEGNPIANFLLQNNIFIIVKIIALIGLIYCICISEKLSLIEKLIIITVIIGLSIAVVNNIIKIIAIRRL